MAVGQSLGGRGGCDQRDGAERGPQPLRPDHAEDGARARNTRLAATVATLLALAGCVGKAAAPFDPHSRPIGLGPAYHPGPNGPGVARAGPVHGLRCRRGGGPRYGLHLEIFAKRLVVIVPPGIGIAPPLVRRGAYVVGGRCSYPARTIEPTGVIQVERGMHVTLGDFFRLWGQPVGRNRLLSFRGPVRVFVAGRPWRGPPGAIPLARHAEITLEVAGYVPPRVGYRFRPGL